MLESMGISVEFSHHEGGPGQQEIDLRYADALSTADNIMTFRTVVREVALGQGIWATFMPKPFTSHPGSGMHTHVSLFEGDRNAFFEAGAEYQLSKVGRQFIAGVLTPCQRDHLRHQPVGQQLQAAARRRRGAAVHLLGSQQPLGDGARADVQAEQGPVHPRRAAHDRRGLQPLPRVRGRPGGGHEGNRGGLRAPAEAEDDVWTLTERERQALGIAPLPKSLYDSIAIAESSELLAETLGEHVYDFFLRNKRAEWEEYRTQVSAYERDRMLPVL